MEKFFAAANTENGFYSLFDDVFSPESFRRIYILKGGPGTGKSTLMGNIGLIAQSKGYDAKTYALAQKCKVERNGSFVSLFLSPDCEQIKGIYNKYIK